MTIDPEKLRDRLRGIVRPLGGKPAPSPAAALQAQVEEQPPDSETSTALPSRPEQPVRRSDALDQVLGGSWRTAGNARSFVVTRRFDPDARYGRMRVGDIASRLRDGQQGASLLAAGIPRVPFVFFDLETTGLSGGAGTHAFLVGCAWFEADGSFVVEQHLMTDYAAERGMLTLVAADLSRAGALVTFNGKSFDAPVIETRYLFHRLTSPCTQMPHVDVLHPARRFWGGHAELGCSLIALEQQLLGARRIGDVPGFEIPERYFQFVRSGDAQPLADVFEHNRLDLLSLAGLTAHLLSLIANGAHSTSDARECLALGRVYERAGETPRAEVAFGRAAVLAAASAASGSRAPRRVASEWAWTAQGIRAEALRSLAVGARRGRQFNVAAEWWRQLLEVPGCPAQLRREATEALAIHHEHRDRDLTAAKMFALKSLESGTATAWGDAVRHRLARIERKMVSERSLFPFSP
ncbi:MAG: ribonuclease H-like domain-containing protein [Vicinamibacterales bacterium]